ncbi:MAG: hypothetical protein PHT14_08720 [Petrimonas sp.]|jgi:hypothetical protein|uniref:hypothetical protein n=1 Tax=Petrimonas sp. TaxID=2023866 RepID=UPI000E82258B|nr:hypothetical protein [Petrimonas sp.]NLU30623.1 hypothetical protein [Bacteroidales bacterium]BBD46200.1 Hypothetical protein PEIBARAKI_6193 [Petrimonas sp. IBARAKI]HBF96624.1 hypothetical protein [Porphyromonadaceae bacterium]MDD2910776.1 hypothetical protein [Petrimonas sp.]
MEFVDILLKRIEGENELKRPVNALICFSKVKTGKALGALMNKMVRFRPDKSSVTLLNLIDAEQAKHIQDENTYKSELFSDIIQLSEANKLSVRTFVKQSENYVEDILRTADEYNCNLVLLGIGSSVFNSSLWHKYLKLREENNLPEAALQQLDEKAASSLNNVSTLLARNKLSTGIFVENNYLDANQLFVPILYKEDAYSFPYFYQMAKNPDVTVTVWDAIGLMESDQKFQKLFQFIAKKTDGRVKLWDNNKKIELNFIQQQDLMIIGFNGWEKLIGSPLSWTHCLPSVLIIKDNKQTLI